MDGRGVPRPYNRAIGALLPTSNFQLKRSAPQFLNSKKMLLFQQMKLYPYREQIYTWCAEGQSINYMTCELRCERRTLLNFLRLMQENGYNLPERYQRKNISR